MGEIMVRFSFTSIIKIIVYTKKFQENKVSWGPYREADSAEKILSGVKQAFQHRW